MVFIGVKEMLVNYLLDNEEISFFEYERFLALRNFVDRYAVNRFSEDGLFVVLDDKEELLPHIKTWGDYFVADIFVRFKGDKRRGVKEHLDREIKRVMFDIMASKLIYGDKDKSFLDYIEVLFLSKATSRELDGRIAEYLWLLKNYYVELGLWGSEMPKSDVNRIVSEFV